MYNSGIFVHLFFIFTNIPTPEIGASENIIVRAGNNPIPLNAIKSLLKYTKR